MDDVVTILLGLTRLPPRCSCAELVPGEHTMTAFRESSNAGTRCLALDEPETRFRA